MKMFDVLLATGLILCLSSDSVVEKPLQKEEMTRLSFTVSAKRMEILPAWFVDFFKIQEEPVPESLEPSTLEKIEPLEPVVPEVVPEPEPEPEPEPSLPVYVYGDAVPESQAVDMSYFDDAAIVGDSRCQGLMAYGGMSGANMTGLGLSVYNLWTKTYVQQGGQELTVLKALETGTYQKIYIGLGINSVGYPSVEKFYSNYSTLIDEIRARQPQAVIYVQSIIPLNEAALQARGYASYFTNEIVRHYNSYIQKLAADKDLYYLDLYEFFLDENGELPKEASGDGIHLNSTYCKNWASYLQSHTIDPELYQIESNHAAQDGAEDTAQGEIYPEEGAVAAS